MFQKSESALDSRWTLGTVDQLVRSRDGLVRRVIIRYQNAKEEFHRLTDRNIRKLVKIWSCDDLNTDEELGELHKRLRGTARGRELVDQVLVEDPEADDIQVPPHHTPPLGKDDLSSHTDQPTTPAVDKTLGYLLTWRSVEPVPDQGQSLLSGNWSDEMIEYEESCCECSLPGILESINLNLE